MKNNPDKKIWPVRFFEKLSLRKKIIALIASSGFLVAVITIVVSFAVELNFFRIRLHEEHLIIAEMISNNLAAAVVFEDEKDANDILQSFQSQSSVVSAVVYTKTDKILASYMREDSNPLPVLQGPLTENVFNFSDILINQEIKLSGKIVGRIIIHASLSETTSFMITRSMIFIILLLGAMSIAIFFASKLGKVISQPILDLAETAQNISRQKNFSLRHNKAYPDETGKLVDSFNEMMQQISNQEEIIAASALRFRRYFELGIVGMAILDTNMSWTDANDRMLEILSYKHKELTQLSWKDVLESGKSEDHKESLLSLLTGESNKFSGECWLKGKNRNRIYAMISIRRVIKTPQQPLHFIVLVQDITDRKLHEEQLFSAKETAEESSRAKDEFLSVMSHELRTPLNPILGFGELLSQNIHDPDNKHHLDIMMKSAKHLLNLIDSILNYIRIEKGSSRHEPNLIDYMRVCDECLEFIEPQALDKNLDVSTKHILTGFEPDFIANKSVNIRTDKTQLRQVILNLITNAVKFTHSGSVRLETTLEPLAANTASLRINIIDTGIGISESDRIDIFTPFKQLDESLTREYGGIGLGLAICKKIIEILGGNLDFESEPGFGSRFWVEMPVEIEWKNKRPETHIHSQNETVERKNLAPILLAEDDLDNRKLGITYLKSQGLKVHCAKDGVQAVEMSRSEDYSLILMDIQMPRMNGFEATKRIRTNQMGKKKVPIVALTAHSARFTAEDCEQAGMDDYISKPLRLASLENILEKWLS